MKQNNSIHLKESKHREGEAVKMHHHETYQILYVLEDTGETTIDHKKYNLNPDNVAFIAPFSDHAIIAHSKLTILVLEFSADHLDEYIQKYLLEDYFLDSNLLELNLFEAGDIRQLLRKMLYEQSIGERINQIGLQVYLSELLLTLAKSQNESKTVDANFLRAERLQKYIDTNYYKMMDAKYIANMLGMSIRHINNIFKAHYNKTPIQYLTEVRMELSKKMLMETDKDIVSICFEVGFESLSTFYRSFKNYTHTSPNQFRARYQDPEINSSEDIE